MPYDLKYSGFQLIERRSYAGTTAVCVDAQGQDSFPRFNLDLNNYNLDAMRNCFFLWYHSHSFRFSDEMNRAVTCKGE